MVQQGICETDNMKLFMLKWSIVGLNVLFWAMGVIAFALGMWLYIENNEYAIFSDGEYLPGSVLLLACGFSVIIVGFLGIVGALFESKIMTFTYMSLLVMAMALYLSAGVWAVVNNDEDELREDIQRFLNVSLDEYNTNDDFKEAWDDLQRTLECCGTMDSSSWSFTLVTLDFSQNSTEPPQSCCISPPCVTNGLNPNIHSMGCVELLVDYQQDQMEIIGPVGITFGLCQIFGVVVCVLFTIVLFLSKQSYSTEY